MDESLLQILKEIKAKSKVKSKDFDYYILEAISEIGDPNKEETIRKVAKKKEEILKSAKQFRWRDWKQGKKELTYGPDPDTSKVLNRERIRFPSDPLPDQTIKIIPDEDDTFEPSPEDYDFVVLRQLERLSRDEDLRGSIDNIGGQHTTDIYGLLLKYKPIKISASKIAKKLGISQSTIKRRLEWIKGNENRIKTLLILKNDKI